MRLCAAMQYEYLCSSMVVCDMAMHMRYAVLILKTLKENSSTLLLTFLRRLGVVGLLAFFRVIRDLLRALRVP